MPWCSPVVLVVEREQELVLGLRHVVDAAGVRGVQDLLLDVGAVLGLDLHPQVTLGDLDPGGAVAVDAHRPEVDDVCVELRVDDRRQHVVRGVHVVVDRVALVPRALHRVRRGALLREVHDRLGLERAQEVEQLAVVVRDVEPLESDLASCQLAPRVETRAEGGNRRERLRLELDVSVAAGEVVDDEHVVSALGQMEGRRPPAETVAAQYQYSQRNLRHPWSRASCGAVRRVSAYRPSAPAGGKSTSKGSW
jgi:hypothetical protein